MYDSRIGRRWEMDPVFKKWESRYVTFADNPILNADPKGLDAEARARRYAKRHNGTVSKGFNGNWWVNSGHARKLRKGGYEVDLITKKFAPFWFERLGRHSKNYGRKITDFFKGIITKIERLIPVFITWGTGGGQGGGPNQEPLPNNQYTIRTADLSELEAIFSLKTKMTGGLPFDPKDNAGLGKAKDFSKDASVSDSWKSRPTEDDFSEPDKRVLRHKTVDQTNHIYIDRGGDTALFIYNGEYITNKKSTQWHHAVRYSR